MGTVPGFPPTDTWYKIPRPPNFPRKDSTTIENNAREGLETVEIEWGTSFLPSAGYYSSKDTVELDAPNPPPSLLSPGCNPLPPFLGEHYLSNNTIELDGSNCPEVSPFQTGGIGTKYTNRTLSCDSCCDKSHFPRLADLYRHYYQVHMSAEKNARYEARAHLQHRQDAHFKPHRTCGSSYPWSTMSALTSTLCAYTMNRYACFQDSDHRIPSDGEQSRSLPLSLILQPSPEIFVAAAIINGVSAHWYYGLRTEDRFRGCFAVGGIISGAVLGVLMKQEAQKILIGILPLMLIASLVICTGMNSIWKWWGYKRGPREHEMHGLNDFASG